jgi:agmatinase
MSDLFVAHKFLGMNAEAAHAQWIYFGIPMDFTASFQPGSRFGPPRIREASYGLETYSVGLDRDLEDVSVADIGDLELPFGNVAESLARIGETAEQILDRGQHFLAVGGEHLVSLPLIQAMVKRYPDLVVVHWDAHADLRDTYLGESLSHATVLRRVAELLAPRHLYQFGIRSGTREEIQYAREHTHLYPEAVFQPLASVLGEFENRPIYVTIDLDVIDPGFFPGTGTPEPGGIAAAEAFSALRLFRGLQVVGMDLVETMPLQDVSQRTAVLAAKMVRDALLVVTATE